MATYKALCDPMGRQRRAFSGAGSPSLCRLPGVLAVVEQRFYAHRSNIVPVSLSFQVLLFVPLYPHEPVSVSLSFVVCTLSPNTNDSAQLQSFLAGLGLAYSRPIVLVPCWEKMAD